MQYKFFVDGEWRHDDRQPFVTGKYGTVNTVLITREPDPISPIPVIDAPASGMNLDVDDEMLHRMVCKI